MLGVPWVFLTLVDEHPSFWVSAAGVDPDPDTGRYGANAVDDSFCRYVIAADGAVVSMTPDSIRQATRARRSSRWESLRGPVARYGRPTATSSARSARSIEKSVRGRVRTSCCSRPGRAPPRAHLQLRADLAMARESARELRAEMARPRAVGQSGRPPGAPGAGTERGEHRRAGGSGGDDDRA